MDIKDLYYSLEKKRLMSAVREVLELNLVSFQSSAGVSVEGFLTILDTYLQSTVVEQNNRLYIQKEGVCIGSSVAPILSEIYLNRLDSVVFDRINEIGPEHAIVRRYVDDIIVCTFKDGLSATIEGLIRATAPELGFTIEKPNKGVLQFLDLRIHLENGLCWEYGKLSPKPILPRQSCHSKIVKAGIVKSLIKNSLKKSCIHFMDQALKRQYERLEDAGYEEAFVSRQLAIEVSGKKVGRSGRNRSAVVPYFHEISHNLKACARRFGIDVIFSSDFKLSRLTPFQKAEAECPKKHHERSVPCDNGVVYEIPLECGFKYVGQTSRCLNDRLTEHKRNVKNNAPNSEIAKHLQECNNCEAKWSETEVLHRERNDVKRVVRETIRIKASGNCISQPSMVLTDESKAFLKI